MIPGWATSYMSHDMAKNCFEINKGKESACNVGDIGSIPGWEDPLEENMTTHPQYSCLKNPHGKRSLAGYSPWGRKETNTFRGVCFPPTAVVKALQL